MTEPSGSRSPLGVVQHSYSLVNLCFCTRCLSFQGCSPRQSLMTLPPPLRLRTPAGRHWLSLMFLQKGEMPGSAETSPIQAGNKKKKHFCEIGTFQICLTTTPELFSCQNSYRFSSTPKAVRCTDFTKVLLKCITGI